MATLAINGGEPVRTTNLIPPGPPSMQQTLKHLRTSITVGNGVSVAQRFPSLRNSLLNSKVQTTAFVLIAEPPHSTLPSKRQAFAPAMK